MRHSGRLMFYQITADEERRVSRSIVMVKRSSLVFQQSGLFLRTASLKRTKTSWYICLFTIWPRCTNSWWTMPLQSQKTQPTTPWFLTNTSLLSWGGSSRPFPHALRRLHLKNLKCLCKLFTKFTAKFHTHTHTRAFFSSSFIVTLSLNRREACACVQFSRCSWTINAHSEAGQVAVCCQNVALGVFSSLRTLSMLVGALFKMFRLFLNTPLISKACFLWRVNYMVCIFCRFEVCCFVQYL